MINTNLPLREHAVFVHLTTIDWLFSRMPVKNCCVMSKPSGRGERERERARERERERERERAKVKAGVDYHGQTRTTWSLWKEGV
jgi:hypothetical protein